MNNLDKNRYKKIQHVNLIILFLNLTISIAKIITGSLYNSVSISADGFHSLSDGLNNIVGMVGVYFAFQPVDDKHPYGHRKFETLTTFFISGLLLITSFSLIKGAYARIINPSTPIVTNISFIIMIISILVNIFVAKYERAKGRELKSSFLISDSAHTLSDVYVSASVIGTLIAVKLGYLWVDTIVSLFIAFLIAKSAIEIIKNGANILCDSVVLDPDEIISVVSEFNEVHSCHKIRSRGCPDDIFLDLHVVANSDMTLDKAHTLIHNIDNLLKSRFPGVSDVYVHVDPLCYYEKKVSS